MPLNKTAYPALSNKYIRHKCFSLQSRNNVKITTDAQQLCFMGK